jgi:hypothetical protein
MRQQQKNTDRQQAAERSESKKHGSACILLNLCKRQSGMCV